MKAVVAIYEQAKEWGALVESIERLVPRIDSTEEKAALLLKAGSVLQDRLNDVDGAAALWARLLEIQPDNRRAGDSYKKVLTSLGRWDEMESFFAASDRWGELVRVFEGQVGTQKDPAVQLDLLFRTARIYGDNLGKADRSVRALERILQIDAGNIDAAQSLEPIYSEQGDFRKLVQILEILASAENDAIERIVLMRRLAETYEGNLRNPMAAFDWIRQVVEADGSAEDARSELERLGALTNQWGTVHDTLADVVDVLETDDERLSVSLTLGRILDEQLGSVDEALDRYNAVLGIDENHSAALDVEQLYQQQSLV